MPPFFIISGYLYEKGLVRGKATFSSFVIGKAKRLLVPYAFWTVFLWGGVQIGNRIASSFMIDIGFPPMIIMKLLLNLLTYEVYYVELLWFVYVLFLFFVVHYLIGEIGNKKWFVGLCLLLGFSTLFLPYPNVINRFLLWSAFFAFGRLVSSDENVKETIANGKWWIVVTAYILLCAGRIILNNNYPGMAVSIYRILKQLIKYSIVFLGVWMVFIISRLLENYKLGLLLQTVGDYSYDIYLMHNPYIVATVTIVCNRALKFSNVTSIIVATVLGVVIPMLISKFIIQKSKVLSAVMIGKWR